MMNKLLIRFFLSLIVALFLIPTAAYARDLGQCGPNWLTYQPNPIKLGQAVTFKVDTTGVKKQTFGFLDAGGLFIVISSATGNSTSYRNSINSDGRGDSFVLTNTYLKEAGQYQAAMYWRDTLSGSANGNIIPGCTTVFLVNNPNGSTPTGFIVSKVDTALGPISTDITTLSNQLFGLALGLAGGFAILRIIIGGFKVATSAGDPKAMDEGRTMITSSVIGLVFILLATTILSIIGVDILQIPGFSRDAGGLIINP